MEPSTEAIMSGVLLRITDLTGTLSSGIAHSSMTMATLADTQSTVRNSGRVKITTMNSLVTGFMASPFSRTSSAYTGTLIAPPPRGPPARLKDWIVCN